MATTKLAINGFGRIGRCIVRALIGRRETDLEIVAVNDLADAKTLAHLLAFDSVHGRLDAEVRVDAEAIAVAGRRIPVLAQRDPAELPWAELGVDIVLECTGSFSSREKASKHLQAGAKRVLLSAPGGADVDATFCFGINHQGYDPAKHVIVSNASCTTNCLAPIAKVLHERFGVIKGHMVTVHSYTNDQSVLDLPHRDLRRARAAAVSMIPTSTGAAKAIALVLPELAGRLDGTAIRVPTADVSIVALSAVVAREVTRDEVNAAFEESSRGALAGVLGFETRPLVSADFIGNPLSSIVDAALTQVVGGDLVEVQSWYDNEWGFSNRMIDLARFIAARS